MDRIVQEIGGLKVKCVYCSASVIADFEANRTQALALAKEEGLTPINGGTFNDKGVCYAVCEKDDCQSFSLQSGI